MSRKQSSKEYRVYFHNFITFFFFLISFYFLFLLLRSLLVLFNIAPIDFQTLISVIASIFSFNYLGKYFVYSDKRTKNHQKNRAAKIPKLNVKLSAALIFANFLIQMLVLPIVSQRAFLYGESSYAKKHFASALRLFQYAHNLNPSNHDMYLSIARVYEAIEDTDNAIKFYQLGISKIDQRYVSYNDLSRIYMGQAQSDSYRRALNLLLKVKAGLDNSDLSDRSTWKERYHEFLFRTVGLSTPSEEIEDTLKEALINKNLSWAYWKLGLYEESRTHVEHALRLMKTMSGTVRVYPGAACLFALNAKKSEKLSENTYITNICFDNFLYLEGSEIELYFELKRGMS